MEPRTRLHTSTGGGYSPDRLRMPAQRNTRLQLPTFVNECSEADPMLGGDHLRSLLANHDRRRIRVSGDHRRHDTRVRHTQLADPLHAQPRVDNTADPAGRRRVVQSEEHTSELQSRQYLVCRLLLEKKKKKT